MGRQVTTKDVSAERCIMDVCGAMDKALQAQRARVATLQEQYESEKTRLDNMQLIASATQQLSEH